MQTHTPEPEETVGYVESVARESGTVAVHGWVAGVSDPVEALTVRIGGVDAEDFEATYGISSPDVREVHPHLQGAECARFSIRVPLEAGEDSLVTVTPWIAGRAGRDLFHVIEPSLPKPPEENIECVGGGFNVSFEFLGHLVNRAGLRPTDSVLDVGCGTGRIAYALCYYLAPEARYEGFDIIESLVSWAHKEITPRHPNFRFQHVDIHNPAYNPAGTLHPEEFSFPYGADEFDLAFLTSVFTHMRGSEVRHYLDEIGRVLRPGGRCFATCFLLDEIAQSQQAAGRSSLQLTHPIGDGFSTNVDVPEVAIGFEQSKLVEWIGERGFELEEVYPGWWSGRDHYSSYQDILVLRRS
jgi:SAM-dependent methyltransferase